MADLYLGESLEPEAVSVPSIFGAVFTWTGALMSVALIGGLGVWGYQLAVRDVSGVPVVRALEGPMRVAPDDPGGEQAEHQGLAVNNVAAEGVAAGPADRLVLAPPPLSLSEEDTAGPGDTAAAEPAPEEEIIDLMAEAPADDPEAGVADETPADMTAMVDELTDGVEPLGGVDEPVRPLIETIPASVAGVSVSPLPIARPASVTAAAAPADASGEDAVAEAVAAAVLRNVTPTVAPNADLSEIDGAEVEPGTRLVQFGAFASPEEARAAWDKMDAQFTDFLTNKRRVIEKALSGGKTFYRLRAMNFADTSDARRFCAAFVAEGQACIPVVAR